MDSIHRPKIEEGHLSNRPSPERTTYFTEDIIRSKYSANQKHTVMRNDRGGKVGVLCVILFKPGHMVECFLLSYKLWF